MKPFFTVFITLQIILFFFMAFHDWVHVPPLTDIRALEKLHSRKERLFNSTLFALYVLVPLFLTVRYMPTIPFWASLGIVLDYGLLSLGTVLSWWIPYLFGPYSAEHKAGFAEYKNTHYFLPAIGSNIIPNTFHVLLHLQVWTCFGMSLYILTRSS